MTQQEVKLTPDQYTINPLQPVGFCQFHQQPLKRLRGGFSPRKNATSIQRYIDRCGACEKMREYLKQKGELHG